MISPNYALCYIPPVLEIFGEKTWEILDFFWKITNYNFQSKRQIMTARGVYQTLEPVVPLAMCVFENQLQHVY